MGRSLLSYVFAILSIWLSTPICKHDLFKRCRGEVHVHSTIRRILTEQVHHTTNSIKASESLSVTAFDKERSSLQPVGPGLLGTPRSLQRLNIYLNTELYQK